MVSIHNRNFLLSLEYSCTQALQWEFQLLRHTLRESRPIKLAHWFQRSGAVRGNALGAQGCLALDRRCGAAPKCRRKTTTRARRALCSRYRRNAKRWCRPTGAMLLPEHPLAACSNDARPTPLAYAFLGTHSALGALFVSFCRGRRKTTSDGALLRCTGWRSNLQHQC